MFGGELIEEVAKRRGKRPLEVRLTLLEILSIIVDEVKAGRSVVFKGFGTFKLRRHAEQKCPDRKRGGTMVIPSHNRPVFVAAVNFKEVVNGAEGGASYGEGSHPTHFYTHKGSARRKNARGEFSADTRRVAEGDGAKEEIANLRGRLEEAKERLTWLILDEEHDATLQAMLIYRYVELKTWDQIAQAMNMDRRWLFRLNQKYATSCH